MIANRKGQTAMEYLMTYGWAIIIVIIAGVALWRLGVFSPSAGKTSTGFDTFQVGQDFKISSAGTATVVAMNADKQGRSITLNEARVGNATCAGTGVQGSGAKWTLTCAGTSAGAQGAAYTGVLVELNYTVEGTSYVETGKINGKYE